MTEPNTTETVNEARKFIAVEGPIGVGKTSLARRLAKCFQAELLLEEAEENPFLERFYQNPKSAALPTQLFFLFQRARELQKARQPDLFAPLRVADFLMEKDRLFARMNLDDDELRLYEQVYAQMAVDAPRPDLVIYLQAPVDVLMNRIRKRGRPEEDTIERTYLQKVVDDYAHFFHYYDDAPLLIVNASGVDLVESEDDFQELLGRIDTTVKGRHYFNPKSVHV
ncbi:MAG: deoxynucleoside kinase [Gammaproteobacteria bacterium]|nr:deoxynucleoside kinase [Gammaproteobacteria bacterium]